MDPVFLDQPGHGVVVVHFQDPEFDRVGLGFLPRLAVGVRGVVHHDRHARRPGIRVDRNPADEPSLHFPPVGRHPANIVGGIYQAQFLVIHPRIGEALVIDAQVISGNLAVLVFGPLDQFPGRGLRVGIEFIDHRGQDGSAPVGLDDGLPGQAPVGLLLGLVDQGGIALFPDPLHQLAEGVETAFLDPAEFGDLKAPHPSIGVKEAGEGQGLVGQLRDGSSLPGNPEPAVGV